MKGSPTSCVSSHDLEKVNVAPNLLDVRYAACVPPNQRMNSEEQWRLRIENFIASNKQLLKDGRGKWVANRPLLRGRFVEEYDKVNGSKL